MSIRKEKRSAEILRILSEKGKTEVTDLAGNLNVSQVTIRKDLDELEEKGFVHRAHGYAELNSPDAISGRLAYHYDKKKRIAEKASEMVHDGDTIMIESGSCCAILASLLAETKQNLTIVTNSAFIADYIRHNTNAEIVLLGGIYQKDSQCLVGPMIRDNARNYHVRYFFIGTDGWSSQSGFTNKDQMRAQAVRDMSDSAENIVILTESEKFLSPGTVPMNIQNHPQTVITDAKITSDAEKNLISDGIQVIRTDE